MNRVKKHRNIINYGKGRGVTGKVQTVGRVRPSRMVRVDTRFANRIAALAQRHGCTLVDVTETLYWDLAL